jgi:hypothetical protein
MSPTDLFVIGQGAVGYAEELETKGRWKAAAFTETIGIIGLAVAVAGAFDTVRKAAERKATRRAWDLSSSGAAASQKMWERQARRAYLTGWGAASSHYQQPLPEHISTAMAAEEQGEESGPEDEAPAGDD